jgi:chemotaxis protein methyltransferase CheR
LTQEKTYLLESRLAPVVAKWNLASIEALAEAIQKNPTSALATTVVEAMTTNESSFFRDKTPFEQFVEIMLPALRQSRSDSRRICIWSAASSSGQEAYSLAMLLKEREAEFAGWHIDIIGTDLSIEMVERAREGVYTHFEVQRGLPTKLLVKYFKQEGQHWKICDSIRRMVRFQPMNLLGSYDQLGRFDIVFCRNVLIYFDRTAKSDVLGRIKLRLAPDGYLVLGGAETVLGLSADFVADRGQKGVYRISPPSADPVRFSAESGAFP